MKAAATRSIGWGHAAAENRADPPRAFFEHSHEEEKV
jgi:hypothetical protein